MQVAFFPAFGNQFDLSEQFPDQVGSCRLMLLQKLEEQPLNRLGHVVRRVGKRIEPVVVLRTHQDRKTSIFRLGVEEIQQGATRMHPHLFQQISIVVLFGQIEQCDGGPVTVPVPEVFRIGAARIDKRMTDGSACGTEHLLAALIEKCRDFGAVCKKIGFHFTSLYT